MSEFQQNFGSEEHKRHLYRLPKSKAIEEQIEYLEKNKFDVEEIKSLFGFTPKSIIVNVQTLHVQQYTKDKILYKPEKRAVSYSELMFDLIFVSIFHELSKSIEYDPSVDQVQIYIIQFSLFWMSWGNATFFINMLLKNDVFERFFLIIMGSIMLGMGMNAFDDKGVGFLIFFLVGRLWIILCKIPFIFHQAEYNVYFITNILFSIFPSILLLFAIAMPDYYLDLIVSFIFVEFVFYYLFNVLVRFGFKMRKIPAVNISHAKDRIGLFTIVVIGEITFSLLINSNSFNAFCLSVLGLIVASRIQYIYFKAESEDNVIETVHGEQRFFAPFYFFLHLPLQVAIALSGASLAVIVHDTARIENPGQLFFTKKSNTTVEQDFDFAKTIYFASLAVVLTSLNLMYVVQKKITNKKISNWHSLRASLLLAAVFATLAILCRYIYIDVFVVSGLSAAFMLSLSGMEEYAEAKKLWNIK